jgi:hypothetical protein
VWTKSADLYKIFDIFGKNVNSVNDDHWQRHRKITSYWLKKSNNKIVWEDTLVRGRDLAKRWASKAEIDMKEVLTDSGTVALHVLSAAAFGRCYDFDSGLGGQELIQATLYAQSCTT